MNFLSAEGLRNIGSHCTMIAAPVQCDIDGIPKGSHYVLRKASNEGLGFGFVANHFDVVPVWTNDESCIVVRVVLRAQTRRTIVFATCL